MQLVKLRALLRAMPLRCVTLQLSSVYDCLFGGTSARHGEERIGYRSSFTPDYNDVIYNSSAISTLHVILLVSTTPHWLTLV